MFCSVWYSKCSKCSDVTSGLDSVLMFSNLISEKDIKGTRRDSMLFLWPSITVFVLISPHVFSDGSFNDSKINIDLLGLRVSSESGRSSNDTTWNLMDIHLFVVGYQFGWLKPSLYIGNAWISETDPSILKHGWLLGFPRNFSPIDFSPPPLVVNSPEGWAGHGIPDPFERTPREGNSW